MENRMNNLIISEREEIEVELINSLIQSYFGIVRKTVADLIPKTIMHLLVNYARENIQNRLVSTLYKEELFDDLLQEDEHILADRQKCKQLLDAYKKAAIILQDIF
jgi:dynamin 1-like protein